MTNQELPNRQLVGKEAIVAGTGGKYMTFKLGEEVYGIEILSVLEIIGLVEITPVPRTKEYVRGVINLRGRVIPVMDLKHKVSMGRVEPSEQSVIIVVQYATDGGPSTMGLLVDEVLEVLEIPAGNIEPAPDFGAGSLDTSFLLGVGKTEDRVVFLMDVRKALLSD